MNKARLQIALDFVELPRALKVAEAAVGAGADIVEAGTPLIKSEGLDCVRKLREMFPKATIVADMKTMDAGKIEAESAAKAGANVVTVCASATPATIRECVEAGRHYGCEVAVDLLGASDPVAAAEIATEAGAAWLSVHCPIDAQMSGADPLALLREIRPKTQLIIAAAGGLNSETAPAAVAAGADIVVIGGAIAKAIDPAAATVDIRKAMDSGEAVPTELFKRATEADLREALSKVRTSNISDGAHRLPCLEGLRPLTPGLTAVGPAVTVRTYPGDWAKPVEAIDIAEEGDVIVIDAAGRGPAIWGELASESAVGRKLAGVVIHGAARDRADIRKLALPLWTRSICSHAGDPHGMGEINQPITISGQRICPGDWIVADDDGVMVLPKAQAVEMTNRAADVLEAENRIRAEIRDGGSTLAKVINLLRWEKKGGSPDVG